MSVVAYLLSLVDSVALIFMSVYFIVTLSDLECGLNASMCCEKLNKVVIPEAILSSLISIVLIYHGCFGFLVFSLPMAVWLIYRILRKPPGNLYFFDPAEIHNRNQLKTHMNEAIVKLIYHILSFFIFLYSVVMSIVWDLESSSDGSHPNPPYKHDGI